LQFTYELLYDRKNMKRDMIPDNIQHIILRDLRNQTRHWANTWISLISFTPSRNVLIKHIYNFLHGTTVRIGPASPIFEASRSHSYYNR
jgi:hypothetical protein